MKTLYTFIFLVFTTSASIAQVASPPFAWIQKRPVAYSLAFVSPDRITAQVAIAPDNSLYVGSLDSIEVSYSTLYYGPWSLDRMLSSEALLEHRTIAGKVHITQMKTSPNGNLYLLGSFLNLVSLGAQNQLTSAEPNPHAFIACLNNEGAVVYLRDLEATFPDINTYNPHALAVADTCVYLGYQVVGGSSVKRMDTNGSLTTMATQNKAGSITDLVVASNGTIYVSGSCVSTGAVFNGQSITPPTTFYNQYLATYEQGGGQNVIFISDVTCPQSQLSLAPDGKVYWTGVLNDAGSLLGHSFAGPATGGNQDFFVSKLDPHAGGPGVEWAWEVPSGGANSGAILGSYRSMETDADGNIYLLGTTRGNVTWAPGMQSTSTIAGELMIQRRNPQGGPDWISVVPGTPGAVNGHTLTPASDGSLYISGLARGAATFGAVTIPAEASGKYYQFVARLEGATTTTAVKPENSAHHFQLMPNPATDLITVWSATETGFHVQITNLLGQNMTPGIKATGSAAISLKGHSPGIYMVRITTKNGTQETMRVVRE